MAAPLVGWTKPVPALRRVRVAGLCRIDREADLFFGDHVHARTRRRQADYSQQRADELIRMAERRTTAKKVRDRASKVMRQSREKNQVDNA